MVNIKHLTGQKMFSSYHECETISKRFTTKNRTPDRSIFYAVNCTHARTPRTHAHHARTHPRQRTSNERQGRRYEEIRNANMWNENMGATTGQQLTDKTCSGEETYEQLIYNSTHLFWALASCRFNAYSAHTLWESMNSLSHGWMYLLCSQKWAVLLPCGIS